MYGSNRGKKVVYFDFIYVIDCVVEFDGFLFFYVGLLSGRIVCIWWIGVRCWSVCCLWDWRLV